MCSLRSLFLSFMLTVSICAAVVPGVAVGQATVVPVVSGLSSPYGVAIAANGDVYIADTFNSRILLVPAGTPLPVVLPIPFITTGLIAPYALSFAPNGDLYIADAFAGSIFRVPAGTTALETVATGINKPYDVAVAANGDVYVADRGTDRILLIPAGSNAAVVFLPNTGLDSVNGVAVSPSGDVYVADSYHNRIVKVPAGTTTPELFMGGLYFPIRLAFTPAGDLYISDGGNNRIVSVAAGTTLPVEFLATGLYNPSGIGVAPSGDVYVVDTGNNRVVKIASPNHSPVADAGPSQTVECSSPAGASVVLNGAGSFDAEGDSLTFTWTDSSGVVVATGPTPTILLVERTHILTLTVGDGHATDADQVTITVKDTTPPAITLKPSINLWPSNHKYRTLAIENLVAAVTDACDADVSVHSAVILSVSSDEPDDAPGNGDGTTTNDIVIGADGRSAQLRSERQGSGNGRVYTVTLAVKDISGNTASVAFKATVPKSQNGQPAGDDGPVYSVNAGASPKPTFIPPAPFALTQNNPNPFNPATQIAYEVPAQAHITLTVFNLLGQEVVTLVNETQAAGRYTVSWNGRNTQGLGVASGVYLYRITSSTGYSETRRMTLLK